VYKGLDIGSGKITEKEMRGVPHHLLDVASPKKRFTVIDFKSQAEQTIEDILGRKKVPIICGGTGFYTDALVKNIVLPDIAPNTELRKKLNKKTAPQLMAMLKKLDPRRARTIDPKNMRRIIRAIEVAKALGAVPQVKRAPPRYRTLTIGLTLPPEQLRERINTRLAARLKQGMINEVASLNKKGLSWKRLDELGLEYRFVAAFLQKKLSREEMTTKLQNEIYHFSKRQMTWFKRDESINWFSPAQTSLITKKIRAFLN
jgi:tRNA dimethylallyltransferase